MNRRVAIRITPVPRHVMHLAIALIPLLLITAYVLIVRPDLTELARYGYAGVFGLMFISSATVLLPMPGLAGAAAAGMLWNPFLVGLAGGIGGATGELVGYVAGYGAHEILDARRSRTLERVKQTLRRYGFFAILVLSAIPNPLFDVVGIAAGSLAYPPWRFYIAVVIGNTIKCSMVAVAGGIVSLWFLTG